MSFYALYYMSIIFLLSIDYFFKNIKFFFYIALSLVIVISGTRYATGYDFYNYHFFYITYENNINEPLFNLSLYVLNIFSSDSQLMFFLYSFFTIIFVYIAIKKYTKYVKTSFLIYLLIPGLYLNTFSIVRQGIAESILFLAFFYFIYKKNYKSFFVLSCIAFLFHYPVIIAVSIIIIFYPLFKKQFSTTAYMIMIIISILLYKINIATILLGLAVGKYAAYLDMIYSVSITKLIISNCFVIGLILFKKRFVRSTEDNFLLNIVFIGTIMINIFADFTPVTRLSYYFLIFQIILVPKLIYSFKSNNNKFLFLVLFVFYYSAMFSNALITDMSQEGDSNMVPYKSYFFKD